MENREKLEQSLVVNSETIDMNNVPPRLAELFDDRLARAGMAANVAFQQDAFATYRATCRPNTLLRHNYDLHSFSTFLASFGVPRSPEALASTAEAWRGMTYGILTAFRLSLEEKGEAISTIKGRIATLHQYCRLAGPLPYGAGVLSADELAAILTVKGYNGKAARNLDEDRKRRGIATRVGLKKATFTAITAQQAETLKHTTTPPPPTRRIQRDHDQLLAARDAIMFCLFIEHALRCGELVALDTASIDLSRRTLSIYSEKTHTFNVHQLQERTEAAARIYLAQINRETGPLFEGYQGQRITSRAVNKRVGVIGELLGFTTRRLSPHDLRHFFTFDALEQGLSLDVVQGIGGWASPYMPLLYAKRNVVRTWKIERNQE